MKTEITDLSNFSKCLIRQTKILLTPEERVRQAVIQKMIELGYPKGLISVEKKVGLRRYDIVCFTKEMTPLLIVECKADKIDEKAFRQACGYNEKLQAPFLCLASPFQIKTQWQEKGEWQSVPFLPSYLEIHAKRL